MTDTSDSLSAALADHYTLERELGRGGMATVYLAHDLKHDRPVALKVLHPELAATIGPERFLREIKLTATLQHPHILPVFDSGEAAGRLWFSMPYVEGESLRNRLRREVQLPLEEALDIVREVADALGHAHERGIVHRDIKPENILLSRGRAFVADFGVARALDAAASGRLTETGLALGTPAYMSPEQAAADGRLDARADVYALGCVLYELLAGQPPYTRPTAQSILARHAVDPVPSLRTVRPAIPESVEKVVARALAKVPADRFRTAHEFCQALNATAEATPSAAGWSGPNPKAGRLILAAGFSALAVLGVVIARVYGARGAALSATRVVVAPFENRTADSGLDVLAGMTTDWLTAGIQRLNRLQVVPSRFVLTFSSRPAQSRHGQHATVRELAEETRAGTVVSGAYYRRGDSLFFEAEIFDAGDSRLIQAIDPVSGLFSRPTEVIGRLRQQVLGALALHFGGAAPPAATGSPPTFEAYESYLRGLNLANQFRYADAIPYLDSAVALDPGFLGAWFTKADVHFTLTALLAATAGLTDPQVAAQFARGDSVLRYLTPLRGRMSTAQTYYLDWMQATRQGDLAGGLSALRRMVAVAPDPGSRWAEGIFALRVNRPQEALEAFETDWHRTNGEAVMWLVPTEAHHMLGDHRRELKEAQQALKSHPDLQLTYCLELVAMAALGREGPLHEALDKALVLPPQPGWWNYGSITAITALELRAHGHSDMAEDVFRRSIGWYRKRADAPGASLSDRYGLARTLYRAGQWREARDLGARVLREAPEDVNYLGFAGVTAAREDDRQGAVRISEQLAEITRPYPLLGYPTLWRARIASLVGDYDQAVTLLQQAISEGLMPLDVAEGLGYAMWLHRDIDFEALRDHPPFQAILGLRQPRR